MTAITISLPDEEVQRLKDEALQRGLAPEELAKQLVEAGLRPPIENGGRRQALERFWELLPPNFRAPSDAEVKSLLDERRMRKTS